jgi:hypothetical protein
MSPFSKTLLVGSTGAALIALAAVVATRPSAAATLRHPSTDPAAVAAGPHVDGNHFTIDGAGADCAVGATCTVTLKLAAQAEFHINQQYPYKFTAAPAAGVTYLGADAQNPNVFTKTAGDFTIADEKNGAMNVKFKVAQKGAVTIGGTFKLSVCSAQNCQLEQQDVAVSVTAK